MKYVFERVDGKVWEATFEEAFEYAKPSFADEQILANVLRNPCTLRFPYRTLTVKED